MREYATSEDVLFVESKIKKSNNYPTINELWKSLHGRFKTKDELGTIIEYFLNENMILIDKGRIVWIHNPKLANLINKRGFFIL